MEVQAEKKRAEKAKPQPLPRIFVSIVSYRDPECQWTVRDLFEKAQHPERIFAGIVWQYVASEDQACFEIETRPDQCRRLDFDAYESRGVCWARHHAQSLWRDEEYVLQIDSHMRFVQGWDEIMLEMLAACPSSKPVLSGYMPGYTPPDTLHDATISQSYAAEFLPTGLIRVAARQLAQPPAQPMPTAFVAGGFIFAPGATVTEVPYDPYLYFWGEETTLATRLWTSGWDLFAPNKVSVFHNYFATTLGDKSDNARRRHWDDHTDWKTLNDRAYRRARHVLGVEKTDDAAALVEIERYSLGTARTMAQFRDFSGIDYPSRRIDGKSVDEIAREVPPDERRAEHVSEFTRIWRDNVWGCPETRSGYGASLGSTEMLRPDLADLFRKLGIQSLADAGCGELNWLNQISEGLNLYLGFDLVPALQTANRERYGARRGHFFAEADIALDVLPTCDAILCRDVLTHLPLWQAQEALSLFKQSGSRVLMATTFDTPANAEINLGGWHPINLQAAPFSLPPPMLLLSEKRPHAGKYLGLWGIDQLP